MLVSAMTCYARTSGLLSAGFWPIVVRKQTSIVNTKEAIGSRSTHKEKNTNLKFKKTAVLPLSWQQNHMHHG